MTVSTVSAANLREGQQIIVQGRTSYSRLASLVDGEALAKSIQQAVARGSKYPTKVPHTTVNLVDAQVVFADVNAATPEEIFVHEKIYDVKQGDNAGKKGYSIDNKSTFLPTILEQDPENPGQYRQLVLERDLAGGLLVMLVLQVFKSGDNENRGIGLQQVVLQEPVKYYSSGMDTSALAARGIVVNGPIKTVSASDAAATAFAGEAARSGFDPSTTQVSASGFAGPVPGMQGTVPAPAPVSPFPVSAPAPAPAQQFAPAPQAAPFQQAAPAPIPAAAPALTPEQQIAQLTQQIEQQKAALAGQGGASAFGDAVPAPVAAAATSPWDVAGASAPAFTG